MAASEPTAGEVVDDSLPTDTAFDVGEQLDDLEKKAFTLDAAFRVPFTNFRVGIDPIIGLLPGIGGGIMMLVSLYIIYKGARLGASTRGLARMSVNLVAEVLIGVIPVAGDLIDFIWSMNLQNVGYLRAEADSLDGQTNFLFLGVVILTPFVTLYAIVSLLLSLIP